MQHSSQQLSVQPSGNQSSNQNNGLGLMVQPPVQPSSQRPSTDTNMHVEVEDDAEFSDFVLSQGYATPRSVADGEGTTSENVAAAHSILFRYVFLVGFCKKSFCGQPSPVIKLSAVIFYSNTEKQDFPAYQLLSQLPPPSQPEDVSTPPSWAVQPQPSQGEFLKEWVKKKVQSISLPHDRVAALSSGRGDHAISGRVVKCSQASASQSSSDRASVAPTSARKQLLPVPRRPLPVLPKGPGTIPSRPARWPSRPRKPPVYLTAEEALVAVLEEGSYPKEDQSIHVLEEDLPPAPEEPVESGIQPLDVTLTIPETPLQEEVEGGNAVDSFIVPVAKDISDDLEVPWKELNNHLYRKALEPLIVTSNGFCFLYAVRLSFWGKYNVKWPMSKLCNTVMDHISRNMDRLSSFDPSVKENLLSQAVDFFSDKKFDSRVVEVLITATAESLNAGFDIYNERLSRVHVTKVRPTSGKILRILPLIFRRSVRHPMLNHYDAVVPFNWLELEALSDKEFNEQTTRGKEALAVWLKKEIPAPPAPPEVSLSCLPPEATESAVVLRERAAAGNISTPPPSSSEVLIHVPPPTLEVVSPAVHSAASSTPGTPSSPAAVISDSGIDNSALEESDDQDCTIIGEEFPEEDEADVSIIDEDKLRVETEMGLRDHLPSVLLPQWVVKSELFTNPGAPEEKRGKLGLGNRAAMKLLLAGQALDLSALDVEPEIVNRIPHDIDGDVCYLIPNCSASWQFDVQDCRHFQMNTSSRLELIGIRKTGVCKGNLMCVNDKCPFYEQTLGTASKGTIGRNRMYWKARVQPRTCRFCNHFAQRTGCGKVPGKAVRKIVEFHTVQNYAVVFHYGEHTCIPKPDVHGKRNLVERRLKEAPKGTSVSAEQYGLDLVTKHILAGDLDAANKEVDIFSDPDVTRRAVKANLLPVNTDNTSWDALANLKATLDEDEDAFYIYRLHNGKMVQGSLDYIFKSSTLAAEIARDMDYTKPNNDTAYESTAYFDVKHSRAVGFKTIALWVYHSGIRRCYRLALMDIRGETTEYLVLFFKLVNAMVQDISKDSKAYFRPRYFFSDHGGPNFASLEKVYGKKTLENRMIGCAWHFMEDAQNRANLLPPSDRHQFIKICNQLVRSHDPVNYEDFMKALGEFVEQHPILMSWARWWTARQCYTFGPYRDPDAAYSNLSEAGNASFNVRGAPKALLDVTARDIAVQKTMDKKVNDYKTQMNRVVSGRGPDHLEILKKDRVAQNRRAKVYADNFRRANQLSLQEDLMPLQDSEDEEAEEIFIAQDSAKHRPPRRKSNFTVQGRHVRGSAAKKGAKRPTVQAAIAPMPRKGNLSPAGTPRRRQLAPTRGRGRTTPSRGRGSVEAREPVSTATPTRGRGRGSVEAREPVSTPTPTRGRGSARKSSGKKPSTHKKQPPSELYAAVSREETLQAIALAEEILEKEVPRLNTPRWKTAVNPNPAVLLLYSQAHANVKVCHGCRGPINVRDPPPGDMVFRLKGTFTVRNGGPPRDVPRPLHFCPDWRCVQKAFPAMDPVEITVSYVTFTQLHRERMTLLAERGLLEAVVASQKY